MNYEDAIKDLIYRYLEVVEYDDEKRNNFVKEISEIIKEEK